MNRSVNLQSSPVQQMMAGNPNNWWNTMRPPTPDHHHHHQPFFSTTTTTTTTSPSPSNYFVTPYPTSLPLPSWHENQDQLPESWSHLLMSGGVMYEEDKEQIMLSHSLSNASSSLVDHVKQETSVNNYVYGNNEEFHGTTNSTWSQIVSVPSSSSSSKSSMLDFSNNKFDTRSPPSDPSSDQCNSGATGGGTLKKARVQPSTTQPTFKVRKEKLGDRITALHQLVSPFGKTDTASVLLESIGYIRFLQSQIEALSLPYLGNGSVGGGNMKNQQQQYVQGDKNCFFPEHPGQLLNENCLKRKACEQDCEEEEKKDLRSRGLCLVPISCTLQVGSDNGADYWNSAFGGGYQ